MFLTLFPGRSRTERRTPETRTTTTTRVRRAARRQRMRTTSTTKNTSLSGMRTTTRTTSTRTTFSPTTTSPKTWRGTSAPSTEPDRLNKNLPESRGEREKTSWAPPRPRPLLTTIRRHLRRSGRTGDDQRDVLLHPNPHPNTAALAFPLPVFYLLRFHKIKVPEDEGHEKKK